jgi:hypothetical protein
MFPFLSQEGEAHVESINPKRENEKVARQIIRLLFYGINIAEDTPWIMSKNIFSYTQNYPLLFLVICEV